jgi:hypothetical protein
MYLGDLSVGHAWSPNELVGTKVQMCIFGMLSGLETFLFEMMGLGGVW